MLSCGYPAESAVVQRRHASDSTRVCFWRSKISNQRLQTLHHSEVMLHETAGDLRTEMAAVRLLKTSPVENLRAPKRHLLKGFCSFKQLCTEVDGELVWVHCTLRTPSIPPTLDAAIVIKKTPLSIPGAFGMIPTESQLGNPKLEFLEHPKLWLARKVSSVHSDH